jgi:hypothetical protein
MRINRSAAFAAGVFSTLVLGAGTAVAANGGSLVLGHNNAETTGTTLTNSHGTALTLNGATGHPPLKVNNPTKVKNLNSDLLDGKSAGDFVQLNGNKNSDFLNAVYTGTLASAVAISNATGQAPVTVPAGTYLVSSYVDVYNPEATTGDYGCHPIFNPSALVAGRYLDTTVARYGSASSQQVVKFTVPTTISLSCFVYTGDTDNLAKLELAEITATRVFVAGSGSAATAAAPAGAAHR